MLTILNLKGGDTLKKIIIKPAKNELKNKNSWVIAFQECGDACVNRGCGL